MRAAMAAIRLGERRLTSCSPASAARGHGRVRTAIAETARGAAAPPRRFAPEAAYTLHRHASTRDGQGHGPFAASRLELTAPERHRHRHQRERRPGAGAGQLPHEPDVPRMVFGIYFLARGPRSDPQRRRREGDRRGDVRPGQHPAAEVSRPRWAARHHPHPRDDRLPRPRQRRDRRPGRRIEQRLRHLVPARPRRTGASRSCSPTGSPSATARGPSQTATTRSYLVAQENYPRRIPRLWCSRCGCCATPSTPTPADLAAGAAAAVVIREIEVLAAEAMRLDAHRQRRAPAWGVAAARPAAAGAASSTRAAPTSASCARLSDGTIVRRGDVVRIETGGGGGWGHPFDREPERGAGRRARRVREWGQRGRALRRGVGGDGRTVDPAWQRPRAGPATGASSSPSRLRCGVD